MLSDRRIPLLNVVRPDSFQTSVHIVSQEYSNLLCPLGKHACTQVARPNRVGLVEQYLPPGIKPCGSQSKSERKNEGKQTKRSPNHGADWCLLLLLAPGYVGISLSGSHTLRRSGQQTGSL